MAEKIMKVLLYEGHIQTALGTFYQVFTIYTSISSGFYIFIYFYIKTEILQFKYSILSCRV